MSQPPFPPQPGPQAPYQQAPYQQAPGQMPYPPQQPAPAKKKWFKRPLVWIVAIIVVITIAVNAGGGDSGTTAAEPAAGPTDAVASTGAADSGTSAPGTDAGTVSDKTKEAAGKMNQAVAAGDLQYTVTAVKTGVGKVGDEYLNQKAQGQYVLVNVSVKNTGSSATTFMSDYVKLYDKDGVEYSSDSTAEIYANDQAQTFLEQINPGNTVKGVLVFDVPQGVTPMELGVSGGMFGAEKKISLS